MRRKSSLLFVLLLCLAQAPLLGLNLGSKPASAQAEQDLLWNHDTGNVVYSVSISSDGNYIAAGSWNNKIYLFSRTNNTPLWSYETDNLAYFHSVSISSDGNYIAAGSWGGGGLPFLPHRQHPTLDLSKPVLDGPPG